MSDSLELSDLIIRYDAGGARQRVKRADVLAHFEGRGDRWAARIVCRLPVDEAGFLREDVVDDTLVRAHRELQRLNEEFQHGPRVRRLLGTLLDALRAHGVAAPLRVVDLGCGLGYVVRWLSLHGDLGDDVELIGCDMNEALVDEARRAAQVDGLDCRFVLGNAFQLEHPAHVYMSTGVLHHFRGPELDAVFAQQRDAGAWACAHWDIQPSWIAPLGAALFHLARMRVPLAQHDGIRSAARSHTDEVLLAAARRVGWRAGLFEVNRSWLPITRTLRPLVACRESLLDPLLDALGPRRHELVDV